MSDGGEGGGEGTGKVREKGLTLKGDVTRGNDWAFLGFILIKNLFKTCCLLFFGWLADQSVCNKQRLLLQDKLWAIIREL